MALRQVTAGVAASGVHMIYDQDGNLIAEADVSTGATMREYIWLPHDPEKWEPVFGQDHAGGNAWPVAVVDDVDSTPVNYQVHVDHLDRPVMMTDASKAIVWRATYMPFGEVYSITGSASLDYRFPAQWFMLETRLL
ncbi:MAG: hypothetical protein ACRED5_06260 [Propylenella sp.]